MMSATGSQMINEVSDWQAITSAPFDRDLELAVIEESGAHILVFPCRRVRFGWIDATSHKHVDISPTHWREWNEEA